MNLCGATQPPTHTQSPSCLAKKSDPLNSTRYKAHQVTVGVSGKEAPLVPSEADKTSLFGWSPWGGVKVLDSL